MKEKTREELEREVATLQRHINVLNASWETENKVIQLLKAAGIVSEEKERQARDLAANLK